MGSPPPKAWFRALASPKSVPVGTTLLVKHTKAVDIRGKNPLTDWKSHSWRSGVFKLDDYNSRALHSFPGVLQHMRWTRRPGGWNRLCVLIPTKTKIFKQISCGEIQPGLAKRRRFLSIWIRKKSKEWVNQDNCTLRKTKPMSATRILRIMDLIRSALPAARTSSSPGKL